MSQSDPVIDAEHLAKLSQHVLLDARGAYTDRNDLVYGAVVVPVEEWIDAARRDATSFENVEYWGQEIAKLSLSSQTTAVVFDDGHMTESAPVWFILQFFGAKALVLNGGAASLATKRASIPVPTPASPMPFQASYNAGPVGLVDRHTLKDDLHTAAIFDARTQAEFRGDDLKSNARGGHLPGAKLLPHSDLLKSGNLRAPSDLREMLSAIGFQTGDYLVTHCDEAAAPLLQPSPRFVQAMSTSTSTI